LLSQEATKARSNDALNANTTSGVERSTSEQLEKKDEDEEDTMVVMVAMEREDEAPQRSDRRRAAEAFERGIHGGRERTAEEGKEVSARERKGFGEGTKSISRRGGRRRNSRTRSERSLAV